MRACGRVPAFVFFCPGFLPSCLRKRGVCSGRRVRWCPLRHSCCMPVHPTGGAFAHLGHAPSAIRVLPSVLWECLGTRQRTTEMRCLVCVFMLSSALTFQNVCFLFSFLFLFWGTARQHPGPFADAMLRDALRARRAPPVLPPRADGEAPPREQPPALAPEQGGAAQRFDFQRNTSRGCFVNFDADLIVARW